MPIKGFIFGRKEGYVYIGCDASRRYYKIGMTKNPSVRQREIQRMNPTFVIVVSFFVEDRCATEKMLHEKFAGKRTGGEWFSLNYNYIRDVVRACAPPKAIWLSEIEKEWSDEIIMRRIALAFAGKDYDKMMLEGEIW